MHAVPPQNSQQVSDGPNQSPSGLRDSGGNRNFYYADFILFWNAEMKRNKQKQD